MRQSEEGHLEADERVGETKRDVFVVGIGTETADGTGRDEEGDDDGLPEGEEQDAFDAEEFGHRTVMEVVRIFGHSAGDTGKDAPEWFEVLGDAEPEHGKTVQAETDTRVVNDTDIEVTRVDAEVTLIVFPNNLENQSGDG